MQLMYHWIMKATKKYEAFHSISLFQEPSAFIIATKTVKSCYFSLREKTNKQK